MIILERENVKTNKYLKISGDDIGISEIKNYSIIDKKNWILLKDQIIKKKLIIGIEIFSDEIFDISKQDLRALCLIQINFKTFKDGRPFTFVKKLRKELKFNNEIRAAGHILPDQYSFLLRCGFNTVEINEVEKEQWFEMLNLDEGLYYQPY
tara:strand:+ start:137 stop:592 length:456 start_codon:yes stop_codon:yes gene_type:complete